MSTSYVYCPRNSRIFENRPACFAKPQQRYAMKQMLAEQEKQHPRIFSSLLTAMRPLMGEPPG